MKLTRTSPLISIAENPDKRSIASAVSQTSLTASDSGSNHDEEDYVMSPQFAQTLVSRTERKVKAFLEASQWVRDHISNLDQIPRLSAATDFVAGRVIAEGGFSNIHEITSFCDTAAFDNNSNNNTKKKKSYVVKRLKPQLALNPPKLRAAAKDICNEIHVLSSLDHPNIVRVQALSTTGIEAIAETCRVDSFFLILERLDQTLLHKISQWRQEGIRANALALNKLHKCPHTQRLFRERMGVAHQVASALAYLHQHRILHNDIKPGNIGFDDTGVVKMFDFGLAVELPNDTDTFDLGNAGTPRYQANEVLKKQPYNMKAESYSLAMLLWEITSLTKPFACLDENEVKQSVTQINYRPGIPRSWPRALRRLVAKGWSKRMTQRPTMAEMKASLEQIASHDYSRSSSGTMASLLFR
ncbi:Probable LIM domain-containing serine/threonine-protein kinase DDB [Seminavis robusta]|uniref:Probable LIM domain-containing serine/threonine-protein kinase DDB n=1 Tax=Seminavis robusta TaxID=568900 RepID=A0A9N8DJE9_9STRA|nr:Probable LIM domain-containing serine/threonine-protein kinase DDB [Seminavis robusta]|eukprot:Sro119_g058180.1 Probable LIM domain-containing serine/threonine-protein kinase DDB (414) ;mRNA; r:78872-80113